MSRAERAKEAALLKANGLNGIQIAERLGISTSYTYELLGDPEGRVVRRRKDRYRGACLDCGGYTHGGDGRLSKRSSLRCAKCWARKQHEDRYWTPERVVEAIQEYARRYGRQPASTDWSVTLMRRPSRRASQERWRGGHWPHTVTVRHVFGTWNAAIRAAGFEPTREAKAKPGDLTPEVLAETVALYRSGLSLAGCGRRLGLTGNGVRLRLAKAGEPLRHQELGLQA